MAPRRPPDTQKEKNRRRGRRRRSGRRGEGRDLVWLERIHSVLVNESERKAMFDSFRYFVQSEDEVRKQGLYRLLQSTQPALFQKLAEGGSISAAELSDETVRGISQIVYQRDTAPELDQVPQPEISDEIKQFNNLHIESLAPAQYTELIGLCKASLPSMLLNGGQQRILVEELPDGLQIMVNRYLKKHLPVGQTVASDKSQH